MKMLFIDIQPINITFNSFITRKNSISYICYTNKDLAKRHSLLINIRRMIDSILSELKHCINAKSPFDIFVSKDVYNTDLKTYIQIDLAHFYISYGKSRNIDYFHSDLKELYKGLRAYSFKLKDEINHVYELYSDQTDYSFSYLI